MTSARLFGALRRAPVWAAVILLYLLAGAITPAMLSVDQALNILQVTAFLGVVATGQTIALLVGGIDLSVAGTVTMTNIVVTRLMLGDDANLLPAVAVTIVLALAVGALNGVLVAYLRVTPLIATLGMNSILFGGALVYTNGAPFGSASASFMAIGQGSVLGLPASAIAWFAIAFAAAFLLRRTLWGRWIYAVGASPRAAALNGVPVRPVLVGAYAASALMACLGGLLITAYIGNPSLRIGDQFLLTSVAAVVVGGTLLTGGVGSVPGTIGGALFITLLSSFTNIAQVSTGTQFAIQGAIIAASVLVYRALGPAAAGR